MRIAVVGAGPAGLVTLYTIQKRILDQNIDADVICFERKSQVGGEWFFANDEESSTYEGLRMNTPYPFTDLHIDYPWPFPTESFPNREQFLKYINLFADQFNLQRFIQFKTCVDASQKFYLSWRNHKPFWFILAMTVFKRKRQF